MKINKVGDKLLLLVSAVAVIIIICSEVFVADEQLEDTTVFKQNLIVSTPSSDAGKAEVEAITSILEEKAEDQFVTETLSEQLSWLAREYKKQARYPHYSVPIVDADLARTPEPFEEARVKMITLDSEGNLSPVSIAASVDKLRYIMGDPIVIQVQLSGLEDYSSVSIESIIKPSGNSEALLYSVDLALVNDETNEFRSTIDSRSIALDSVSQELLAIVNIEIDGIEYINTVPFKLSEASAVLKGIADSKQREDSLEISLDYEVEQAGYYFVNAVLDDAETSRPLLALQGEGRMSTGQSTLKLMAHQQALKDAGSQGPYVLRVVRSFRGAEPGEGEDIPTQISHSSYFIPDFSFDAYVDAAFYDPAVEARIEALTSLSSGE